MTLQIRMARALITLPSDRHAMATLAHYARGVPLKAAVLRERRVFSEARTDTTYNLACNRLTEVRAETTGDLVAGRLEGWRQRKLANGWHQQQSRDAMGRLTQVWVR